MNKAHPFPCPNCGSYGTRRYFVSQDAVYHRCRDRQVMTTECSICDYLMTVCSLDGRVIETSSLPLASNEQSQLRLSKNVPVKLSAIKKKQSIASL